MFRFFLLMMILTGAAYALVTAYFRSVRAERLEQRWEAQKPDGVTRKDFVAAGLADYDRSFQRKAILLILVVPFVAVGIRIWLQNFSGHR